MKNTIAGRRTNRGFHHLCIAALSATAALAGAAPAAAQAQTAAPQATPTAVARAPAANPVTEALRERIEALNAGGAVTIEGEALYATRSMSPIYAGNGYQPLWDRARL